MHLKKTLCTHYFVIVECLKTMTLQFCGGDFYIKFVFALVIEDPNKWVIGPNTSEVEGEKIGQKGVINEFLVRRVIVFVALIQVGGTSERPYFISNMTYD